MSSGMRVLWKLFNEIFLFRTGKTDGKKLTAIMHTILNQLKGAVGYYLSQKSLADNLLQQRASLPNLTFGPNGERASNI